MIKQSVIVQVYNVELYIYPCIESIFKQGFIEADHEVIIVSAGTWYCNCKCMEIDKNNGFASGNLIKLKKVHIYFYFCILYGVDLEVLLLSDRKRITQHLIKSEPNLEFSNGLKQKYIIYKVMLYIYIELLLIYK